MSPKYIALLTFLGLAFGLLFSLIFDKIYTMIALAFFGGLCLGIGLVLLIDKKK